MTLNRLRPLLFLTVIYTLLVILWGAWVRISHSGDGCGDTWPLCHGQLIPMAERGKTWVEYAHRVMSGLYGILVILIYIWCRKLFPAGHRARKYAFWFLFFCIVEALLGANLVLFKLVGTDDSFFRALVIGIHQINSLLLSGVAALLLLTSSESSVLPPLRFPGKAYWKYFLFMMIAMTGAWAALSSTLFPAENFAESISKELAEGAPAMMRLRSIHPLLALTVGIYICLWLYKKISGAQGFLRQAYLQTCALWSAGLTIGILTLLLASPLPMKLTHLLLAHLLWISLLRIFYLRDQFSRA
jgi:cytochrome c oxidase assembly protein subunit 15